MTLPGCAHRAEAPAAPQVIVREVRETPPAELTRCPSPPVGLPETGQAQIPADWRAGIIRLAKAYAAESDQLDRLIQWHTGASCREDTAG